MMSNEFTDITVDSLSYKELQALAMSLDLPGKMKQGVLVEAIKARQNRNEQAVTMILEANRQRRILTRQHQQQLQQQQLLKINSEIVANNKRKSAIRSRMKRSASEMEMDAFIDEEGFKRSKLAAALIHHRRPTFFTSLTTGATSLTIRKEQQQCQQPIQSAGGCSMWDQQHAIMETVVPLPLQSLPIIHKPLPDLSKELSILPTLSNCSNTSTTPSSSDQDLGCCSVGSVSSGASSSWSNADQQSLPQSSFESCDPTDWIEDPYDLNSWKSLPNIKVDSGYENEAAPSSNNSSGFFEDHQTETDLFTGNGDLYRAEDFIATTSTNSAPNSHFADYQPPQSFDSAYQQQDQNNRADSWCESLTQTQFQPLILQQQQQQQQQQQELLNQQSMFNSETRVSTNFCYGFECYQLGGPHFRVQRPGNPTAYFVPSGRNITLPTFCNMLPRVASYVQ